MRFVLLLVAVVIAAIAMFAAFQLSGKNTAPPPVTSSSISSAQPQAISTVDVLVARSQIPLGAVIDESMIDKQPWPANLVLQGFIVSGTKDADIVGRVARSPFQAREPFIASKLANPKDAGFLAAELPQGMRAITIATDAVAGVAGYVFPGDHIDILLTHNIPQDLRAASGNGGGSGRPSITEVLVQNVRVLGINVRDPSAKEGAPATISPSSMTLEISDADAQRIRLAEKVGTLSVTLRSLADRENNTMVDPSEVEGLTRVEAPIKISR